MGLRFPQQIWGRCFFLTTTFKSRARYGEIPGVYEALALSLTHCLDKYDALLPGYVFMPSHLHLLCVIDGAHLGNMMRDFKKYVAQKAMKDLGIEEVNIWQERYDRVAIYSEEVFRKKLDYIHYNPVKAALATVASSWPWSSASAYEKKQQGSVPVWAEWSW